MAGIDWNWSGRNGLMSWERNKGTEQRRFAEDYDDSHWQLRKTYSASWRRVFDE
jgi:hypothetical protein